MNRDRPVHGPAATPARINRQASPSVSVPRRESYDGRQADVATGLGEPHEAVNWRSGG
jgi:hypothetical protein